MSQRLISMPPPGGSTRITSAPSAARVAPPSGAAMKAAISTTRRPARIGALSPRSASRGAKAEQVEGQFAVLQPRDDFDLAGRSRLCLAQRLLDSRLVRDQHAIGVRQHERTP